MIEGQHTLQIAGSLNLSQSTIKSTIRKILAKLGVSSREEAVSLAVHQRIVS
jgi:DNA-binding CsgD family transcriptional regulator